MLEQLNVFSDSDVDSAAEALNDVSDPLADNLAQKQEERKKEETVTALKNIENKENPLYLFPIWFLPANHKTLI